MNVERSAEFAEVDDTNSVLFLYPAARMSSSSVLSERRATSCAHWIWGLCREFTDATGWTLQFTSDYGNNAADYEWCWHQVVTDGEKSIGTMFLELPDVEAPPLTFESAYRLAELFAQQVNRFLKAQQESELQANEISSLVTPSATDTNDLRTRLTALVRAAVVLPSFHSAALLILEPSGNALKFRFSQRITEQEIPQRKRLIFEGSPDLVALESGHEFITRGGKHDALLPANINTALIVEVANDAGPMGTLWMFDRREHPADQNEIDLLQGFGRQIADVIERTVLLRDRETRERFIRELDVVASTTSGLQDVNEDFPGCDVAVRCLSRCEVGGDLCETIRLNEDQTMFVVGDASGDSIPAAIVMTATRGALHAVIESYKLRKESLPPDELVDLLNRSLVRVTASQQFISLIAGVYDSRTGIFHYTNAGHPPPIHISGTTAKALESQGLLLGIIDGTDYSAAQYQLAEGDLLILFSDGIIEARGRTKEMFRNDGILEAIRDDASGSAQEVLERIWSHYEEHTGGENQDDRTLMVLKTL
jgi:sigma-B regulation protein RsbU (phosphoserine phosphatase)